MISFLPHLFRHLKDRILDLPEFLLLGGAADCRSFFRNRSACIAASTSARSIHHARRRLHPIDDGIDLPLEILRRISLRTSFLDAAQLQRQFPEQLLCLRMLAGGVLPLLCEAPAWQACFPFTSFVAWEWNLFPIDCSSRRKITCFVRADLISFEIPVPVRVRLPRLFFLSTKRHNVGTRMILVVKRRVPVSPPAKCACLCDVVREILRPRSPCVRVIEAQQLHLRAGRPECPARQIPRGTANLRRIAAFRSTASSSRTAVFAHGLRRVGLRYLAPSISTTPCSGVSSSPAKQALNFIPDATCNRHVPKRFRNRKIAKSVFQVTACRFVGRRSTNNFYR